jgi:adenosylmethionine-8-amino-7-oxononanoate aminotransferase
MTQVNAAARTTTGGRREGETHSVLQMTRLQNAADSGALVVEEGSGIRLRDVHGHEYLDAIAGLFNVNVGYGRGELADVAADSLRKLSYGTNFFGRSTPPALDLAEKLAELTPSGITRFFMALGGSDAVDTAIKLVRHRNALAGKPAKVKIIARRDSYHGMTLGGTTATGQAPLRENVGPLLPGVLHVGQPDPADGGASAVELEKAIIKEGAETVAAFIGEPIALPPGVAIPPDDYWPAIRDVCDRHDVLLIADEVVNGFGRTGRMFACEHWGLEPDLMIMSKGLTSGYLPLGAVGMREDFFAGLSASNSILPHGFTAGGHPAACAVALANIDIIENEGLVQNAATVGAYMYDELLGMADRHDHVTEVRALGMLAAFDLAGHVTGADGTTFAGDWVTAALQERRVLVRNYKNTIAIGPSLAATRDDIDEIVARIEAVVQDVAAVIDR